MFKYFIIVCNGIHGTRNYLTREEAKAAANYRNSLHGANFWHVEELWLDDPYADDDRPYKKLWL